MSYLTTTDPELVKAAQTIWEQMMHPSAPKLGLEWRIVIERNGKAAAEVTRTPDTGIKIGFYGDDLTASSIDALLEEVARSNPSDALYAKANEVARRSAMPIDERRKGPHA